MHTHISSKLAYTLIFFVTAFLCFSFYTFYAKSIFPLEQDSATSTTNNHVETGDDHDIKNHIDEYESTIKELTSTLHKSDPTKALAELSTLMASNPQVNEDCHAYTHELGHIAYDTYQDFGKAIMYQDDVCGSGYLHGIIEATFENTTDIKSQMNTVCKTFTTIDEEQKCYHGVGHGIMFYTKNDVPKSISLCDTYNTLVKKIACAEGVFMENFSTNLKTHTSIYLNADNPAYPCTQQTILYKGVCYFYAPIYYLSTHQNNFKAGLDWCSTVETGFTERCLVGMGSRIMKSLVNNPQAARDICIQSKDNQKNMCIDGLVSYYLVFTDSITQATLFCQDFDEPYKQTCLKSVNDRRKSYPNT